MTIMHRCFNYLSAQDGASVYPTTLQSQINKEKKKKKDKTKKGIFRSMNINNSWLAELPQTAILFHLSKSLLNFLLNLPLCNCFLYFFFFYSFFTLMIDSCLCMHTLFYFCTGDPIMTFYAKKNYWTGGWRCLLLPANVFS